MNSLDFWKPRATMKHTPRFKNYRGRKTAWKLLYASQAASFMPSGFQCESRIKEARREMSMACDAWIYPSKSRSCKGVRALVLENHSATSVRENLQEMKLTHVGLASFKTCLLIQYRTTSRGAFYAYILPISVEGKSNEIFLNFMSRHQDAGKVPSLPNMPPG